MQASCTTTTARAHAQGDVRLQRRAPRVALSNRGARTHGYSWLAAPVLAAPPPPVGGVGSHLARGVTTHRPSILTVSAAPNPGALPCSIHPLVHRIPDDLTVSRRGLRRYTVTRRGAGRGFAPRCSAFNEDRDAAIVAPAITVARNTKRHPLEQFRYHLRQPLRWTTRMNALLPHDTRAPLIA